MSRTANTPRRWSQTPTWLAQVFLVLWLAAVPFSTGAAEVLLGLAVAVALAARFTDRSQASWPYGWSSLFQGGPVTRPVPWLILGFILLYLVSVLTAVDVTTSAGKIHKLFRFSLFFVLLAVPWSELTWQWAYRLLLLVTAVLVWFSVQTLAQGYSRADTPNLHYNTLSQVAAMISLLLLAAVLYGPSHSRGERWLYFVSALVATGVLVVTLSRAAWVGWLTAVFLLLIFRLRKRYAVTILVIVVAVPALMLSTLSQKRADLFNIQDPEFTRRYDMWRMARAIIADYPWTGIGPGGIGAVYDEYKTGVLVTDSRDWPHVHNDVLEVALSHGIPATLVWLTLAVWLYYALARRLLRYRGLAGSWTKAGFAGAGVSLHLFYLCGLVHDNYPIYIKVCLLLFLWGLFVSTDRQLGSLQPETIAPATEGVAA